MPPKDKKPEKSSGWNLNPFELIILLLLVVGVLGALMPTVFNYFRSPDFSFYGFRVSRLTSFFTSNVQLFKSLGFIIAGVGAVSTFVLTKKADAIWRAEKAKVFPENINTLSSAGAVDDTPNPLVDKWKKILEKSESTNPSDWRLAIIEADIMLDDLLNTLRLPGDTMGEKLKAVEKSDFNTIESAWEAHKARNMIAHSGQDFLLNQRETRRIISLYEVVFKEFFLI